MSFDPQIHHRRSIRLKGYDYSQTEAYFVTLVACQSECLLGNLHDDKIVLSEMGEIVNAYWLRLPNLYSIQLDEWVIMPNHMHGIIWILDSDASYAKTQTDDYISKSFIAFASPKLRPIGTKSGSLGAIVQNYKSVTTRKINQLRGTPGLPIWQRNYFERIIRDEGEWERIRLYIQENPTRWIEYLRKVEASAQRM